MFHHRLQRPHAIVQARDPSRRVCRGPRRVKLNRVHDPALLCFPDLVGSRFVSQVEGHQRLEGGVLREGVQDALAVLAGVLWRSTHETG